MKACPQLLRDATAGSHELGNAFWRIVGQVSGAVSNRWFSVREVGVWVVKTKDMPTSKIIINMGKRHYTWLPWNWFSGANVARPRDSRFAIRPATSGTHSPSVGVLVPSENDLLSAAALRANHGVRRPMIVLAGPTGQWRLVDVSEYFPH